jgi:preprotein translocase subunit SecG
MLAWAPGILNVLILLVGLFLILLVLIQRGKGGGLAGAFGGVGGSSAFGSRAGDTFTRITLGVALFWVLLIMAMVKLVQPSGDVSKQPGPVPISDEEQSRLYVPPSTPRPV